MFSFSLTYAKFDGVLAENFKEVTSTRVERGKIGETVKLLRSSVALTYF